MIWIKSVENPQFHLIAITGTTYPTEDADGRYLSPSMGFVNWHIGEDRSQDERGLGAGLRPIADGLAGRGDGNINETGQRPASLDVGLPRAKNASSSPTAPQAASVGLCRLRFADCLINSLRHECRAGRAKTFKFQLSTEFDLLCELGRGALMDVAIRYGNQEPIKERPSRFGQAFDLFENPFVENRVVVQYLTGDGLHPKVLWINS